MFGRLLHGEVETVEVGLAEAALDDLQQAPLLQFVQVTSHAALARAHVFGELGLTGETSIIAPSVFEQHGVRELGADRNILLGEDEIGHLSEAMPRDRISAYDLDIAVLDEVTDPTRLRVH